MNKEQILERLYQQNLEVQDKLEQQGFLFDEHYWIESVNLQGSQNYGAGHEGSDVDSKMIIVPTVETMLRGINLTADYSVSNNEKVSVKTFPEFVNLFFKGNVNNLEMLYTDYAVGTILLDKVKPLREEIVKATMKTISDAVVGMMVQKQKSLHKGTETTQAFVDEHGYDLKDAIHIFRLGILLEKLRNGISMGDAIRLCESSKKVISYIRQGIYDKEFIDFWTSDMIDCASNNARIAMWKNNNEEIVKLRKKIQDIYVAHYKENFL
jgi:hypothetical protein